MHGKYKKRRSRRSAQDIHSYYGQEELLVVLFYSHFILSHLFSHTLICVAFYGHIKITLTISMDRGAPSPGALHTIIQNVLSKT